MPTNQPTAVSPSADAVSIPLVEMVGIDKSFPGVRALSQARFELRAGEVHAFGSRPFQRGIDREDRSCHGQD